MSVAWKELRQKAIDRDDGKCIFCNRTFREVHHVKYPKRFKEDHVDNLLVVCEKCHRRLHGIRDDSATLLEEIQKRLADPKSEQGYVGLNMSACRSSDEKKEYRLENFNTIKRLFKDYLPNMLFHNFKLQCWKGNMWWGDEEWDLDTEKEFLGWPSEEIILWIIKHKWGKNEKGFSGRQKDL